MVATIPFETATPQTLIWVSPDGDDANSGSRDAPLQSIQLAMDRATPGTAILLQPGQYVGNFEFERVGGTADNPIWLVAADGPGTATITAASDDRPVIAGLGEDNIVIRDLTIQGGHNGIQFSQSGSGFTDLVDNIVIEGNTVTGASADGIKVSQANNARVFNNVVDGAGEEGIDFVAVTHGEISGNEVSNVTGPSAGLFAKAGSSDILIANNYVHDVLADGILVGGFSSAGGFLPGTDYEAKNVEVVDNVVERADRRPVAMLGGQDVDIHDNLFASTEANDHVVFIGEGSPQTSPRPISANVSIHDNVFDRSDNFARIEPSTENVDFSNNVFDGVISGDMREAPPEPSGPFVDTLPELLLDAPVWSPSARFTKLISGTSEDDVLTGGDAHEFLSGNGGTDAMIGGGGDDSYDVTIWRDVIVESPGEGVDTAHVYPNSYALADNVENLRVRASGGGTFFGNDFNNMLTSGKGDDVFAGGDGDDLFVIRSGRGHDTVLDFQAGAAGRDTIDLRHFADLHSLDDVLALSSEDSTGTVINLDSVTSLTLSNLGRSDLAEDDFLLNRPVPTNQAPTAVSLSNSSVAENGEIGTVVGLLATEDPDAGETFTYSLTDDGGGMLTLNGNALMVAQSPDFEAQPAFDATVRVTDSGGNTLDQSFAIEVVDIEGAVISGTERNDRIDATETAPGQPLPTSEEDTIKGRAGNDVIFGLGGNDLLDGGSSGDRLSGGPGDDTYVVDTRSDSVIELAGDGMDLVQARVAYRLPENVESLTVTGGSSVGGTGNELDNLITGNGGKNELAGLAGADTLIGGDGRDIASYAASAAPVEVSLTTGIAAGGDAEGDRLLEIEGLTGSGLGDVLEGDAGSNALDGGAGIDTLSYQQASGSVTVTLSTEMTQETGGAGNDTISAFENLTGSEFGDRLTGDGDDNIVAGLGGDDRIYGGNGDDTLIGGTGSDCLDGGDGADDFVFNSTDDGLDRIFHFMSGSDQLTISAAGFGGGLAPGGAVSLLTVADLADLQDPLDPGTFLLDNAGDDAGFAYFDGTGGSTEDAVAFADLQDVTSLSFDDLVLV